MIPARVRAWVESHVEGPVRALSPSGGGRTGTTWRVEVEVGAPLILRCMPVEVWAETGRRHVASEALGCRLLAAVPLPTPRLVATDPDGTESGAYCNLTTWLPGSVRLDPLGLPALQQLARAATVLHATPVPVDRRPAPYTSWAPARPQVPGWSSRPDLWRRAIDLAGRPPPPTPSVLVHRDYHPGNVLWQGDVLTGVIDWAETSWGPADADVVHAATNLALLHDLGAARAFRRAYRELGGRLEEDPDAARHWMVTDLVGFLPDPLTELAALVAGRPDLTPELVWARLDLLLAEVLPVRVG